MENSTVLCHSFEAEIHKIMDKYLENNRLSYSDIRICHEICNLYQNKLQANDLTQKINLYSNISETQLIIDDDTQNNDKIFVSLYEYLNNKDDKNNNPNKNDEIIHFVLNLNNIQLSFVYETSNGFSNDGKYRYTNNKFLIDDYLILKKEQFLSKDKVFDKTPIKQNNFINLSYIDEIFNKLKIKSTIPQFLNLFTTVLKINTIFEVLISDIENNPDKFRYDQSWDSDSDISLSSNDN